MTKSLQVRKSDLSFAEQLLGDGWLNKEDRKWANRRKDAARLARLAKSSYSWADSTIAKYRGHFGPVWQARALARRIGLTYWPALIREASTDKEGNRLVREDGQGYVRKPLPIDPAAFLAAERVLTLRHGLWNKAAGTRGGWDYQGHYGVSPYQVVRMWHSAGCRNSRKFRMQVALRMEAKKGDTVAWFRNYVVGHRWLEANRWLNLYHRISRKVVAVLGRLPWQCRWAAMQGLDPETHVKIRIRDLNWAAVRLVGDAMRAGDTRTLAHHLPPRAVANVMGLVTPETARDGSGHWREVLIPILCPAYPRVRWEVAQRISWGESPVEISGRKLVRKEAHEWLSVGGATSPEEWLSERLSRVTGCQFHHRSMKVLRWLERLAGSKDRWEAVLREREAPGPGGVMRRFTALSVLDEVSDDDILTGRDSVDVVLRRAAERLGEAFLTEAAQDHRLLCPEPVWAKRLGKYCRVLRTPSQLVQEGRELGHCVGGYASAVEEGQCWILSISSPAGRSTVELSRELRVRQHFGAQNSQPPRRHQQLLTAILRRIGGKQ